jgi:glutamate racemase
MVLSAIIHLKYIMSTQFAPIGVFDSGYGGLTVFRDIVRRLPEYDYLYLGDNARVPYGSRSFETVYRYTLECVEQLFHQGCRLVILACNTASAKALRTIQQRDLPGYPELRRVLGVLRPTTESVGHWTRTGHVGILATPGTVASDSYPLEIGKFFPEIRVWQQACPLWVPLIEHNEHRGPGAVYFVQKYLDQLLAQSPDIDVVVLACTHYPLLADLIAEHLPPGIRIVAQGPLVADRLADYLQRHPEIETLCSRQGHRRFFTTDDPAHFSAQAGIFFGETVVAERLTV